jgi:hypothetical protein
MKTPEFVSDAVDVLNDIYRRDISDPSAAAASKKGSILAMHTRFGRTPEAIATQLKLDVADVKAVIATITQSHPVRGSREPALSAWF